MNAQCSTNHLWLTRRSCIWPAVATMLVAATALGQDANDDANARDAKLPIERVVLFTSGVGYFEHQGQVHGDATIDLKFNVDDVNDLLKSMVLQDLDGGHISTVTYGSRDPITKTLQTFAIDLTSSPTLGQLLSQIRGEKVEIDAPTKIRGTIVSVETRREKKGPDEFTDVEYLNLLTDEGLRRIALDSVARIKLANDELDAELRQALAVLATGLATDKKTVSLEFLGDGNRNVRVGYIQESPVWKTSYRLVLDDDSSLLQGWAIVENTTETDWNDVNLSLVSGRPISFVMDLYSPLYADRPEVVPELYASLRPQVYEQDLRSKEEASERLSELRRSVSRAAEPAAPAARDRQTTRLERSLAGRYGGLGGAGYGNDAQAAGATSGIEGRFIEESLQAAAQGADVGELFQYDIKSEVTLPRRRSAMLPIINDSVQGKKVSIYNPSVHGKHPLNGVRLTNSSDLHLMQGPVTVFDGGVYAGDARLPDLEPGGERLLSYALDLNIEVAPTSESRPQRLISVSIQKGVLTATFKQTRQQTYTLKNSSGQASTVLVEHPIQPQWELVSPKEPTDKTRDRYRFAVEVVPSNPAELAIEEQQTVRQDIAVNSLDDPRLQFYLSADAVPSGVKEALQEVVSRKRELSQLNQRKQQREQRIAAITQEQGRIRENMEAIDRNTDLYNRYVKKFADQEDEIETLRREIQSLEQELNRAQQALEEYLMSIDLP